MKTFEIHHSKLREASIWCTHNIGPCDFTWRYGFNFIDYITWEIDDDKLALEFALRFA